MPEEQYLQSRPRVPRSYDNRIEARVETKRRDEPAHHRSVTITLRASEVEWLMRAAVRGFQEMENTLHNEHGSYSVTDKLNMAHYRERANACRELHKWLTNSQETGHDRFMAELEL